MNYQFDELALVRYAGYGNIQEGEVNDECGHTSF